MLQKAERPSASDAEPSKDVVNCFPANDCFHNSYVASQLQVLRLRRRFNLSEHLAQTIARLVYSGGLA